jgi:hypothetical protein
MTTTRRQIGRLLLGAGLAAPVHFTRTAVAQPKAGDELVVGCQRRLKSDPLSGCVPVET